MINRLKALMDAGRVPHALVIDGSTYDSRLLCAKELAASLVGDEKKVMSDSHPDVITVLPEEKKKTLSVEIIRMMRDDAYIIPNENEKKVYIIAKAELMLDYAQNALLKILEEPPQYATFILLCDTHSALLGTVLSRVAVFTLEDTETEDSDESRSQSLELARKLASVISRKDRFALMESLSGFDKNNDLLEQTLTGLTMIIRDSLVIKAGSKTDCLSTAPNEAAALAGVFSEKELMEKIGGIEEIISSIHIYANKTLTLTRLEYKLSGGYNA